MVSVKAQARDLLNITMTSAIPRAFLATEVPDHTVTSRVFVCPSRAIIYDVINYYPWINGEKGSLKRGLSEELTQSRIPFSIVLFDLLCWDVW